MICVNSILSQYSFDDFMQLKGEVFRNVENRSTQRVKLNDTYYFIKQHRGAGWKEIFKNLLQFRCPVISARNEWQAILHLQKLNINTLEWMAFGSLGMNPASMKSFLLTKEVLAESLETICRKKPLDFKAKLFFIKEIAKIVRTMHQSGMNHRDCYLCHFLWDEHAKKLILIDLHRAQIRKKTPERWMIKDLAGLYFSSKEIKLHQKDFLRFIRHYAQAPLKNIFKTNKKFWQKVTSRGEALYAKHQTTK